MNKYYNLKNIYSLFINGFNERELRDLCFYEPQFRSVHDQLPQGISKAEIIHQLLEYAEQKVLLEILLDLAKKYNPDRYEKHRPYYHTINTSEKPRILVVEDDPKVIIFITDNLEYMGFEVLIARNGLEGLQKATKEKPDLLILDIMMPKMDGLELCRRLKEGTETRHIPILMLTAKGQAQDQATGLNIGADDYITKPYDKAVFEARVKALLRRFYDNLSKI